MSIEHDRNENNQVGDLPTSIKFVCNIVGLDPRHIFPASDEVNNLIGEYNTNNTVDVGQLSDEETERLLFEMGSFGTKLIRDLLAAANWAHRNILFRYYDEQFS